MALSLWGSASGYWRYRAYIRVHLRCGPVLAHHPKGGFVDGLPSIRFPSWLPSQLLGFWFFLRVSLRLNVLAFLVVQADGAGRDRAPQRGVRRI